MSKFTCISLLPLFLALSAHALHFAVKDEKTQKYCLILDANVTGALQYTKLDKSTATLPFSVPEDGSVDFEGICGTLVDELKFNFVPTMTPEVPETETQEKWHFALKFGRSNGTDQRFELRDYMLTVHYYSPMNSTYLNDTVPFYYSKPVKVETEWIASGSNGFSCSSNKLPLNVTDSFVQFNKLKVLAFDNSETGQFKEGQVFEQCALDIRTSDLVPIIVGACLAGLVIVVLVAYLIGRARAKRQGYASV